MCVTLSCCFFVYGLNTTRFYFVAINALAITVEMPAVDAVGDTNHIGINV